MSEEPEADPALKQDDSGQRSVKRYVPEYQACPFAFRENSDEGIRVIAWSSDLDQMIELMYGVIDSFGDELEVLMKVKKEEFVRGNWIRYYGELSKTALVETMKRNEGFIFQDADIQFNSRDVHSEDYIVMDEHGVIYIYGDPKKYIPACEKYGFENKVEKLVSDFPGWQRALAHGKSFEKFVQDLNLEIVE